MLQTKPFCRQKCVSSTVRMVEVSHFHDESMINAFNIHSMNEKDIFANMEINGMIVVSARLQSSCKYHNTGILPKLNSETNKNAFRDDYYTARTDGNPTAQAKVRRKHSFELFNSERRLHAAARM